jgi:hypothetical protein
MDYRASERAHVFFRAGYFREERDNGKHSTINGAPEANDTTWIRQRRGARIFPIDEIDASVALTTGVHSNFLAVPPATPPPGRMTSTRSCRPCPPASWRWRRAWRSHLASAGADWRRVTATAGRRPGRRHRHPGDAETCRAAQQALASSCRTS